MKNLAYRKSCLSMEVDTSIKLLKKGMGDLQNISGTSDFYHVPILLLSSGYERLIKCLICLASCDDNLEFKKLPYKTGREGHNLDYLLKELLLLCGKKNYSSKFPAAKADIDFLNDKDLRKIITLLSDFAQGGRYYNLDIVLNRKPYPKDPAKVLDEIKKTILKNRKDISKKFNDGDFGGVYLDNVHKEITHELIIVLEKFARALARLFALADFGDLAKQLSSLVHDCLMLMDEDLGTRDYQTLNICSGI